jgi:hypothetical protein
VRGRGRGDAFADAPRSATIAGMTIRVSFVAVWLFAIGCRADDDHGIVEVELQGSADVFMGTERITAMVDYLDCLTAYYEDNADATQAGGSGVFDDWKGQLCDMGIDAAVDCDVATIEQSGTGRLTITYDVRGGLSGRRLAIGPLPTARTADCSGGLQPEIRLSSASAIVGRIGGASAWHSDTFSSNQAVVGQGAPITVDVVAN